MKSDNLTLAVLIPQPFHFFLTIKKMIFSCSWQLYKEIEIRPKTTEVIRFDNAESCTIGYGTLRQWPRLN